MRRLLIRSGGIGDFIVSLPALECLRAQHVEVWSLERHLPLVRFADEVASIGSTGLELAGVAEPPPILWNRLRCFDEIVSWYGSNRGEFRDALAGYPVRFLAALPPPGCRAHASTFYIEQVRQFTPCAEPAVPRISCSGSRANFIAIQPFSGSARKNWPLANYRALAKELPLPVLWCAGPDEPLDDAVRIDNLYELACWLHSARLYIGNDSGISHLAAAAGTAVLALFGPTDPAVWAPVGSKVVRAPNGDLNLLGVDEVLRAVHDMLESRCV